MGGELEHAACLFGAMEALRQHIGMSPPTEDIEAMRNQMSAEAFPAAWAAGRAMSPERAIDYALALPEMSSAAPPAEERPPAAPSLPTYPAGLTAREVEVLRLMALGHSYAQIADHLVISPRTVNAHVTSIFGKLGVTSRAAATRIALDHHLA
jgi:DNA-binding NarL/FixJ family response regulator